MTLAYANNSNYTGPDQSKLNCAAISLPGREQNKAARIERSRTVTSISGGARCAESRYIELNG